MMLRIGRLELVLLLLALAWMPHAVMAVATGNINTVSKYAWSENTGWQNYRPTNGGVTVFATYLSGFVWAENIGFIKLGNSIGGPYSNTTPTNWGVNRDNTGKLTGYAWSESAGWINFNPTHSQVTISTVDGTFNGFAWAENVGWIHFKNGAPIYNVATSFIPDITPPVIATPVNITVEATAISGTAKTNTAITAFLNAATTSDNVDAAGIASNNAPAIFPLGVTTVTFNATDAAGNAATPVAATVTVVDTTVPVITGIPLANVTAEATGTNTPVTLIPPVATDLFAVTVTNNAPAGGFPLGTTVVIWTATDANGNQATSNQNVLISDTIAPVITGTPLMDVAAEATGTISPVTLTPPAATDLFAVTVTNNAPAGGFPLGTTVVIWTATDANGNQATSNQNVIVSDTIAPVIIGTPLMDVTAEATGTISPVTLTPPATTDLFTVTMTNNAPAGGFPLGITVVIWTATDANGNQATSNQNVIVSDTIAPVIIGTPLMDVAAEATGTVTPVTLTPPAATDLFTVTVTNNAPAGGYPLGITVVLWTATDANGNQATSNQNVIISDTIAPTLTLTGNNPATLIAGQTYTDAGATASDLVDGALTGSITTNNPVPNPATEGVFTVTYNVTDAAGNTSSQTRTVAVAAPAPITSSGGSVSQLTLPGMAGTLSITSKGNVLLALSTAALSGSIPANTNFPFGIVSYTTSVGAVGGSTVVRLAFSSPIPASFVVYKVDGTGAYTKLPSTILNKVDAYTLDMTLTDGDPLTDMDGVANGVIVDPVAVGGATAPGVTLGGGGGCTLNPTSNPFDPVLPVLGALFMISAWRRKRQE